MSAECETCGFDLVGSQYDERGLWCVPCDYKRQLAEAQGKLEMLVAEMLRRADCSEYEHKLYVPGRICSCGLDEALSRILSKEGNE